MDEVDEMNVMDGDGRNGQGGRNGPRAFMNYD